jgi:hypothetical protein
MSCRMPQSKAMKPSAGRPPSASTAAGQTPSTASMVLSASDSSGQTMPPSGTSPTHTSEPSSKSVSSVRKRTSSVVRRRTHSGRSRENSTNAF